MSFDFQFLFLSFYKLIVLYLNRQYNTPTNSVYLQKEINIFSVQLLFFSQE
jgi:hypothetical protein